MREERLHQNKYEELSKKLNEYEAKHHDLLQRYSSMESFVEEFCFDANQSDDDNEIVVEQLTKWTNLLQSKQDNLMNEISSKVEYGLNNMKNELNINKHKMNIYEKEMGKNIVKSVLNDVICSVVTISNNNMISSSFKQLNEEKNNLYSIQQKISFDQSKINSNKRMMESQITQLNGQKQIISNLNKTINNLCEKIKEYEHHIHRLTFQLKQLSLINKASKECNTDFNIQQIENLSNELLEKEIKFDKLQSEMQSKEELIQKKNNQIEEFENEYNEIYEKYNNLKKEYKQFDVEYNLLEKENNTLKSKLMSDTDKYREIEANNQSLKHQIESLQNQMESVMMERNELKENEYNYKLNEQSMKEKYKINYDEFNKQYKKLQNKYEISENTNKCLQNKVEQYHSAMLKHKEQSKGINYKYNQIKFEYEKLENEHNNLQNEVDETQKMKIRKYENKIKQLMKQINHNMNNNVNENSSQKIEKLKKEINKLQDQLYEGSNIRRELREYLSKYQREGQMKLNKNYKKLTFMKQLVFTTFNVLNQERQYVEKNNSLRQHFNYLTQKLQENQENNQSNNISIR